MKIALTIYAIAPLALAYPLYNADTSHSKRAVQRCTSRTKGQACEIVDVWLFKTSFSWLVLTPT